MTLDLRVHNAAVKAYLQATLGSSYTVYNFGQVPGTNGGPSGTRPSHYLLFSLERVYDDATLLSGEASEQAFRIITRPVAKVLTNLHTVDSLASRALHERFLAIADRECFVRFENGSGESFQDGYYESTSTWTYQF